MDIIILAVIAVFIFLKLRSQLGSVDEDQKREAIKKFIKEQAANSKSGKLAGGIKIVSGDGKSNVIKMPNAQIDSESQEILSSLSPKLKTDFESVLSKCSLTAVKFLDGASKAFEIVLESFAKGDEKVLKALLSDVLNEKFSAAITERKNAGNILETKIVSIDKMEIIDAKIADNFLIVAVKFYSKQINYLSDEAGKVIEGSKDEINDTIDSWSFKKPVKSKDPNWIVSSTSY